MKRLARIIRSAAPGTAMQFRKEAYGKSGTEHFLRDVIAMANASVDGIRYIVTGAEFDSKGQKHFHGVPRDDFSRTPSYQSLANQYIEPPLRLRYESVMLDGDRVGIIEIGDCQDRPYMMRADYSESLRRGDAYTRVNQSAVRMGRRQLQMLFEKKFQDSISGANIEIGFPGEIIHKERRVDTCKLEQLPSAIASAKLHELIEAKDRVRATAATSRLARLTYARLFGTDIPYEDRSTDEILAEMEQLEKRYRDEDESFLFEDRATKIQLVVFNQNEDPIRDASITLVMPNPDGLYVASRLPKIQRADEFIERTPLEQSSYPAVSLRKNAVQVSVKLGDIPSGEPIEIFESPLRICAGAAMNGRRIGIQYGLYAQNLRRNVSGKLRLQF